MLHFTTPILSKIFPLALTIRNSNLSTPVTFASSVYRLEFRICTITLFCSCIVYKEFASHQLC